jgi:outer membrane biosynthesis protein TonB
MNRGKVVSGFVALGIYLGLIFLVLFFYNIHKTKAKNYVEKNSDRVTVTLVNSDKTVFNKSEKVSTPNKPTIPMIVPPVPLKRATPKPVPKKVVRPKPKPKPIPKKVVRPKPKPKPIHKKVVKPKHKPKPIPI